MAASDPVKRSSHKRLYIAVGALVLLFLCVAVSSQGGQANRDRAPAAVPAATATNAPALPTSAPTGHSIVATATSAPKPTDSPKPPPTALPILATATSAPKPTETPKPPATATAVPKPASSPTPALPGFGEGAKIVGTDIEPGTYRALGGSGCYWERLSGFGGTLQEILANDLAKGPVIVTIAPSDKGFKSARCGRFTLGLTAITASQTTSFSDGTYAVGIDIAPGTWKATGGTSCYWQRMSGFSGNLSDIIANDNVKGDAIVQIGATDKGFRSSSCGTWTKIN